MRNWRGWILIGLFAVGCGGGAWTTVPNPTATPTAAEASESPVDDTAESTATPAVATPTIAPTATPAPTVPSTPEPTDEPTEADGGCVDLDNDDYCDGQTVDCNDVDPSINPGASDEDCDGIDQDCDGIDGNDSEAARSTAAGASSCGDSVDEDKDGYLDTNGDGDPVDCDDSSASIHPEAEEIPGDGIDQDCDGQDLEPTPEPTATPEPEEPTLTPEPTPEPTATPAPEPTPVDADGDGFRAGIDCDDSNASIHPGAQEVAYDGIDQDCDLCDLVDVDCDGYATLDGQGNPLDCNDADKDVHPDAVESCDGEDEDCDGQTDEDVETVTWYLDQDGDGYGGTTTTLACSQPPGYERLGGDCDDADSGVHPFAEEACDGEDDDCDGQVDDGFDKDADGFTTCAGDCNDASAAIHPGATDACNGVDEDCDGVADEGFNNVDTDKDGFSFCAGDCDDWDSQTHPGATETCDGEDDDCDGSTDEGLDCIPDDLNEDLSWARVDGRAVGLFLEEVFPSSVTANEVCVTGSGVNSNWDCDVSDMVTLEDGFLWYYFPDGNYRVTWYGQVEGEWARYDDKCLNPSTDSILCYANSGAQGAGFSLCFAVTNGVVAPLSDATCAGLN